MGDYNMPHMARRAKSLDSAQLQQRGTTASCSLRGGNPDGAHSAVRVCLFETPTDELLKGLEKLSVNERVPTNPEFERMMIAYNVMFYNVTTKCRTNATTSTTRDTSQRVGGTPRTHAIVDKKKKMAYPGRNLAQICLHFGGFGGIRSFVLSNFQGAMRP